MAKDWRVIGANGQRLDDSCENGRFLTNIHIRKGKRHGECSTKGSVFNNALILSDGFSLWLEHVIDKKNSTAPECYWLMWYDSNGQPTFPGSSVFGKEQLSEMVQRVVKEFVP